MATGLLAKKIGMTQIFDDTGDCIPVTVLECGPCTVIRRKTAQKDGYDAVVLGFGALDEKHEYRLTKPEVGVFKKAGTPTRSVRRTRSSWASSRPATSSRSTRSSSSRSASTSRASRRAAASRAC